MLLFILLFSFIFLLYYSYYSILLFTLFSFISYYYCTSVGVKSVPTIGMNTGCHTEGCAIKTVQSFVCRADKGMFAIKLLDQFIINIDALTTQDEFKYMLEGIQGIDEVTVLYGEADGRVYSGECVSVVRVCMCMCLLSVHCVCLLSVCTVCLLSVYCMSVVRVLRVCCPCVCVFVYSGVCV